MFHSAPNIAPAVARWGNGTHLLQVRPQSDHPCIRHHHHHHKQQHLNMTTLARGQYASPVDQVGMTSRRSFACTSVTVMQRHSVARPRPRPCVTCVSAKLLPSKNKTPENAVDIARGATHTPSSTFCITARIAEPGNRRSAIKNCCGVRQLRDT